MYIHVKMTAKLFGNVQTDVLYESIFWSRDHIDAVDRSERLAKKLAVDYQKQVVIEMADLNCETLTPAMCSLRTRLWHQYDTDEDNWLY